MLTTKRILKHCQEYLSYDHVTGRLIWKNTVPAARHRLGKIAGGLSDGRHRVRVLGLKYQTSWIVWLMNYGKFPKYTIDHIDHDVSNNRLSNLRDVLQIENMKNHRMHKNNKSGVTGVSYCKTHLRWVSFISVNGKKKTLARSSNFDDAVRIRKAAEKKLNYHQNHGR